MSRFCAQLLLGLGLVSCLAAAQAADFDYTWLGGGPMQSDDGGITYHGWSVDGSVAVSSQFTLQGDFYRFNYEQNGCVFVSSLSTSYCQSQSSRWDYLRLGAGWHFTLADDADLLADAYYARDKLHQDLENAQFGPGITCPINGFAIPNGCVQQYTYDATGNGYQLDVGVRLRCTCTLEFKGYLGHVGVGSTFGSSNFVRAEGAWQFADHWTLVLDARHFSEPGNQYRVGARYLF